MLTSSCVLGVTAAISVVPPGMGAGGQAADDPLSSAPTAHCSVSPGWHMGLQRNSNSTCEKTKQSKRFFLKSSWRTPLAGARSPFRASDGSPSPLGKKDLLQQRLLCHRRLVKESGIRFT